MSTYLTFVLEPLKPLLFRKPVPFRLGGYAPTYHLPMPSTIAGMIRTAVLDYHKVRIDDALSQENLKHVIGNPAGYTGFDWILVGPYVGKKEGDAYQVYYPVPLDLLIFNKDKDDVKNKLKTIEADKLLIFSNMLRLGDEKYRAYASITFLESKEVRYKLVNKTDRKFMPRGLLERYLEGASELGSLEDLERTKNVMKVEVQPGLKLSPKTKTLSTDNVEGKIKGLYYQVEKVQFKDGWAIIFGIVAKDDVAEILKDSLDDKILRLGGRGGLVHCSLVDADLLEFDDTKRKFRSPNGREKFKLVLTTPAVLQGKLGSVPENLADSIYFYAASKETIGGWDYKNDKMKNLDTGVSAGSVYYFDKDVKFDVFWNRLYVDDIYRNVFGSGFIGEI